MYKFLYGYMFLFLLDIYIYGGISESYINSMFNFLLSGFGIRIKLVSQNMFGNVSSYFFK